MTTTTEVHTLANGLTVISEFLPAAQSAGIGFFVRTGASDETEKESGVSHFLEHMMFKGTPKRSAMDITYELGNLGAQANAGTSEESTIYYAAVIPENFKKMQELLADMMQPALDRQEYDTEKKVILEEIALYKDKPTFYLIERATRDYFSQHPAGNSVLGTVESIGALDRDEMKAYFDRRYSPSNMVLVAAGHFDRHRFLSDAEALTKSWKKFDAPRVAAPFRASAMMKEYRKKNLTQAHLLFLTDGASAQSEFRYPMALLAMMMGDSNGSRLYWELVDKGLVEDAGAENEGRDDVGMFLVYASMDPARLEQVNTIVQGILKTPLDFTSQDLERAKNKLIAKVVLGGELPMGRLMSLGYEWNHRRRVHSLKRSLEEIESVTRRDIETALKNFPLTTWAQFRLLPE